jgi:hypothetical protein
MSVARPPYQLAPASATVDELLAAINAEIERGNTWTVDIDPNASAPPSIMDRVETYEVPRRTHRRSRIRAKWEKRYGTKTVEVRMRAQWFGKPEGAP